MRVMSVSTAGWAVLAIGILLLTACAAGQGSEWKAEGAEPAGFFIGLWHGALLLVTLVVSFFADQVSIYETNNVGVAYEIGFVLGVLIVYGGGCRATVKKDRSRSDWDRFEDRVERRIKRKIAGIADDGDWDEIGAKVEAKVKEGLRRWLDEDDKKPPVSD